MQTERRKLLFGAAALVVSPAIAMAGSSPSGRVLLTVSGKVRDGSVAFDRAMLQALDWRDITTFTSFTEGEQSFGGPTLASLLAAVDASGQTLSATAINDYTVRFPVSDAREHDVILAMTHNGREMRVRDKGPIWIVYPLSKADAEAQKRDAEMIWQLDRIVIE